MPWIVLRTFSKAYGLAGLRIGYSLSSPEIADILNRVRQPFNNNRLALVSAEAALSDAEAIDLAARIDQAPAGGDILGTLTFLFVLLLVTDILGFTKIFPFTRAIR